MSYLRVLDLTRMIFSQGLRNVCLISSAKFQRDLPCVSTTIKKKKLLLGCVTLAPLYAGERVTSNAGQLGALKEFLLKYCWSDQPKTFRIRLPYAIFGELVQITVTFAMILTMTYQP